MLQGNSSILQTEKSKRKCTWKRNSYIAKYGLRQLNNKTLLYLGGKGKERQHTNEQGLLGLSEKKCDVIVVSYFAFCKCTIN